MNFNFVQVKSKSLSGCNTVTEGRQKLLATNMKLPNRKLLMCLSSSESSGDKNKNYLFFSLSIKYFCLTPRLLSPVTEREHFIFLFPRPKLNVKPGNCHEMRIIQLLLLKDSLFDFHLSVQQNVHIYLKGIKDFLKIFFLQRGTL